MIDFIDRVSSGKKIIKYENGTTETVTIENAEDATVEGTPINREAMMAIQGFIASDYNILDDGTVVQTNSKGHTLTITPFNVDGVRTKTFVGEKTIVLKTILNDDGTISEVLE